MQPGWGRPSLPVVGAARVSAPGTVTGTLDEAGDHLVAHEYEPTGFGARRPPRSDALHAFAAVPAGRARQ
jgi:hypothetical protein